MPDATVCPEPVMLPLASQSASAPLVIVAASGTGGDILPFIVLAQALQQRGHQVMMMVPRLHEALVALSGIPFHTMGTVDEWQSLLDDPMLWDEREGWGVIWNGLVPHLGALSQLIQTLPVDRQCVVVCHPVLVAMSALAKSIKPDLRIVAAYLAPSNFCSSHEMLAAGSLTMPAWVPLGWKQAMWRLIHKKWIDPVTLPSLNEVRSRHGLPAVAHFFEHMLSAPDASIGLFPSWFASVQPDWPHPFYAADFMPTMVQQSGELSVELTEFVSAGSPPIVFTPGTGHKHAARYFQIAVHVLKRMGRRGIFVTPHTEQLPAALPPDIMWQAHIPFSALLPRVAAIVHHGGIGTTADALRAGTPQLIVPFAYDQFDNAQRAKRLGVAKTIPAKYLSPARMQKQLEHLLTSTDVTQACLHVAQDMAQKTDLPRTWIQIEAALFS